MTMEKSKAATEDSACGMTVGGAAALDGEPDGKPFCFCSEHCRKKLRPCSII
jgi:YHS domain-containing protein